MVSSTSARRNHQIKVPEVRVVNEDGEQLGVMTTKQALQLAEEHGVDLVEVSPKATPPVCRLMDYGKYQYQQSKRQQEAKKKQAQIQLKEVKFRPKTDEHDLQTKLNHIKRFLSKGDRCKVTLFFRGREIVYKDQGQEIMQNIQDELSEMAKVEQPPKFEGRTMNMILAPLPKK